MQDLISDTLAYLKDPLLPRQTLLGTAEEYAFFQVKVETKSESVAAKWVAPQKKEEKAAAPLTPPAPLPTPIAVEKAAPPPPSSTMKQLLQKVAPAIKLTDQVPDDAEAKRIASGWKEKIADADVVFLACDSDAETLEFLKGLAKAVDQHLAKSKIIMAEKLEKEKRWDLFLEKNAFKLIIASAGVQSLPELMRFYKSYPSTGQLFLDQVPLLVLSPALTYRETDKKASLWKTLCQTLSLKSS